MQGGCLHGVGIAVVKESMCTNSVYRTEFIDECLMAIMEFEAVDRCGERSHSLLHTPNRGRRPCQQTLFLEKTSQSRAEEYFC